MKAQILTKDGPEGLQTFTFDEGAIKRFHFDDFEVTMLLEGKVVWRGDIGFSLEDEE